MAADTGEEIVTWTAYPFAAVPRYYPSSKKSFCTFVEVDGGRKAKYKRLMNMKISAVTNLLHHMGRIFQDNSTPPSPPANQQADRKYRRQIQQRPI